VTAERFVTDKALAELLTSMDNRTALLLGHARWRTCGDERVNNNHPIRAGEVIGTHNGTIFNADYRFRRRKQLRMLFMRTVRYPVFLDEVQYAPESAVIGFGLGKPAVDP
jgi:predicted glutamine amidotransferase